MLELGDTGSQTHKIIKMYRSYRKNKVDIILYHSWSWNVMIFKPILITKPNKIKIMDKVPVFLSSWIQAYCIGLKLENKKVEL